MKNRDNIKPLYVLTRPGTAEFISKAADHAKVSVSEFARDLLVKAAEKELGKKAPEVEPFGQGGRLGIVAVAAAKAGLTVAQLKNKLATEALGGTWKKPAARSKKAAKKAA